MRNRLAEDVMNQDMLHLMECYQKSLGDDGEKLNSSIDLLRHTSILVKNFRDQRPLQSYNDPRLEENRQVLQWFLSWEDKNKSKTLLKSTEIEKSLISYQTREDIMSL